MSFDDRLRRQLNEQAHQITIEPGDPNGPAVRAARRQTRRRVAVAGAFVAVIGLSAAWITTRDGDEPGVATAVDSDGTDTDAAEDASASDESTSDESGSTAAPGTPLTFTPVDATGAPGGYNITSNGAGNDLYYVLSTAPGLRAEEINGPWRNDTLYAWDGDSWSTSTFADRFVTTITPNGDLLYTLSTGTNSGDGPAVGTSSDGGANWDWTPIDLPADLGVPGSYGLSDAVGPAGHLVVAWSAPFADWNEAFELAREAGLDIGWETHNVISVDSEAIRYVGGERAVSCAERYWTGIDDRVAVPASLYDESWGEDGPTEEQLAQFREDQQAYDDARLVAQPQVLDELRADPDCAVFAECQTDVNAWDDEQAERERQIYVDLGVIEPGQSAYYELDWESLDDDTQRALDEALSELWEDSDQNRITDPACEEALYGPGWDPEDIETVTWASLGVTPPDSWNGAISAFLVEDGAAREIDAPFDPGFLQSVTATDTGFAIELVVPETDPVGFVEELGAQRTIRWTGGEDGWQFEETTGSLWNATTAPDGTTYGFSWSADGTSRLIRAANGVSVATPMPDMFGPGYEQHGISSIDAGDYGVAAVSIDWESERSAVAFSTDGVSWASTEFDGYWIDGVIVGDGDVMVIAHPFGTTGNTEVFIGRT